MKHRGFTLIEVIIYVAIVALVVIALFSFAQLTRESELQFYVRSIQNNTASRVLSTVDYFVRNADGYVEDTSGNTCFSTSTLWLYYSTSSVGYLPPGCAGAYETTALQLDSYSFTSPDDTYLGRGGFGDVEIVGDRIYAGSGVDFLDVMFKDDFSLLPAFGDSDNGRQSLGMAAYAVEVDGPVVYTFGDATDWQIEKREIRDGDLCAGSGVCDGVEFGSGGIIAGGSTLRGYDMKIEGEYIYALGKFYNSVWSELQQQFIITELLQLVKYDKQTGALCDGTVGVCGGVEFGTNGTVGDSSFSDAKALVIDDTYAYAVGYSDGNDWRIGKYQLSDGTPDSNFGTSGVVSGDSSSRFGGDIAINDGYLYISGSNDSGNFRLEKRDTTYGNLDTTFGGGDGIIETSTGGGCGSMLVDDPYLYIAHATCSGSDWTLEKRLLSDGSLVEGFGDAGISDKTQISGSLGTILKDGEDILFLSRNVEVIDANSGALKNRTGVRLMCMQNYPSLGKPAACTDTPPHSDVSMNYLTDFRSLSTQIEFATTTDASRDAIESRVDVFYLGESLGFNKATVTASSTSIFRFAEVQVAENYGYDDWWNNSWFNRRKLTFDNSAATEDLTSYPIHVALSEAAGVNNIDYAKLQSNGEDIRFVDVDSVTELSYEIERWDTTATSTIWVKVPNIENASTTDHIWMYYNNPVATDNQNATDVWSSSYTGVWHFDEDPSDTADGDCGGGSVHVCDSTSNNNDGVSNGTMTSGDRVWGQTGYGYALDGLDDYVNITANATFNITGDISLSAWIKTNDNTNNYPGIISKTNGTDTWEWDLGHSEDDLFAYSSDWTDVAGNQIVETAPLTSTANFFHIAFVKSGTSIALYVNGALGATGTGTTAQSFSGASFDVRLGTDGPTYDTALSLFDGILDEPRVRSSDTSASWLAADYANGKNTYTSYGSEQSRND